MSSIILAVQCFMKFDKQTNKTVCDQKWETRLFDQNNTKYKERAKVLKVWPKKSTSPCPFSNVSSES